MTKKIKCKNCGLVRQDEEEDFYSYFGKVYCYECIEDYFNDELISNAFEKFLDDDCERVK